MKYTTKNVEVGGTWLQGTIDTNYKELVNAFGKPSGRHDDYKCDAQWEVQFDDDTIATIYNWKNGINYLGRDGLPVEEITEWNIGGNKPEVVDYIKQVLASNKRKRIEVSYE